ncbi:MAG: cytochrome C oxidase subunit IV family protein [Bacteroidota bacterium]|nr:cytochrome C oxidase subunit IV family protein [Bacteroidota bacterium]
MGHLSYEEGKKVVFKGLIILGIVTIAEVMVALIGKGYIIQGFYLPKYVMYFAMISMSLYKAYFIVYEFMHMKYEVPGLVKSVLMPTLLLIWAIIAFFTEGSTWHDWRRRVNDRPIAAFQSPKENHPVDKNKPNEKDTKHPVGHDVKENKLEEHPDKKGEPEKMDSVHKGEHKH